MGSVLTLSQLSILFLIGKINDIQKEHGTLYAKNHLQFTNSKANKELYSLKSIKKTEYILSARLTTETKRDNT